MCYLRMIVYHKFYRLLSLYFVIALACKFLKMSVLNREHTNPSYISLGFVNFGPFVFETSQEK